MNDSSFSFIHQSQQLVDVVDESWASDKLPNDELIIPPDLLEDAEEIRKVKTEDIWTDFGLQST